MVRLFLAPSLCEFQANHFLAMIYYAPTMFASLGLNGNTTSLLATGVYGIVNCLSTIPALLFIDKVGRRPLLMCGAAGTVCSSFSFHFIQSFWSRALEAFLESSRLLIRS